jgi:hypothetical protein
MIVRILGEGQFELPEGSIGHLNTLDAALEAALEGSDDEVFQQALAALLANIREVGAPLEDDSLESSDVVLPFADASREDVAELLREDGLIPG